MNTHLNNMCAICGSPFEGINHQCMTKCRACEQEYPMFTWHACTNMMKITYASLTLMCDNDKCPSHVKGSDQCLVPMFVMIRSGMCSVWTQWLENEADHVRHLMTEQTKREAEQIVPDEAAEESPCNICPRYADCHRGNNELPA